MIRAASNADITKNLPFLIAAALLLAAAGTAGAAMPGGASATTVVSPADNAEMVAMLRVDAARHEHGEGVQRDPAFAAALYCEAARLGDAESQYALGWMHANGRGVLRNDAWAAYFFDAAARQGLPQAASMLPLVGGGASVEVPPCMQDAAVALPPPPAAPEPEPAKPPRNFSLTAPRFILDLVRKMAPEYRVQPQLALAIISAESNFDSAAVSPKNAQGLMQLIPETAERFNVSNPFDAKQNIRGGLTYLRWLLAYFEGDLSLVAAAYNAGEGTVDRYLGVPPFAETRAYVKRVIDAIGASAHPFDARVALPSARLKKIHDAMPAK